MPTYQTLLPQQIYSFLDEMCQLYSQLERVMYVRLMAGETRAVVEKSLASSHKVDSTTVRNVYHNLKGKIDSVKELQKISHKELKTAIAGIDKSIKRHSKQAKKKAKRRLSNQEERFIVHQKKRRLAIKKQKLEQLERQIKTGKISLCFGTKKLFKAQYNLEDNGYKNKDEWLKDWRSARGSNFLMVGAVTYSSGNQLCKLKRNGTITITVPPALIKKFGSTFSCDGVKFRYGQEYIDFALTPKRHKRGKEYRNGTTQPVTHRFVKKEDKWYLHTHVNSPDIPYISNKNNGCVGIDLNVNNIAWSYCDRQGNLKATGQINCDLENKSSSQTTQILSNAIGVVIKVATKYCCPIAIEKLDFSKKKATLREHGKKYAKMLSSFAYSKFGDLVKSKGQRAAIEVVEVNPAYSSLIGLIKYMSLYGLNSGTAAALVLARRSLRLSERLPRVLYALLSPVDDNKHVWSYWARISKLVKGCQRRSFFGMKVRVGDKPINQCSIRKRKSIDKSNDTPINPNNSSALGIVSA